ncbi:MAG: ligand-binding sensor domain-containing protein [Balneolaceae bacterium]
MPKPLLILTILAVSIVAEQAVSQSSTFRVYSIEQGLSESVVHSILQDQKGYLWIGTGFGLNRFNGHEFRQFYESDGLPDTRINTIFEDDRGRLWLGTDRGIAMMENQAITVPDFASPIAEFAVLDILKDTEGNIWFATSEDGVWRYGSDGRFTNVTDALGYRGLDVRALLQTPDGAIWLGARDGLFRMYGRELKRYGRDHGLPECRIRDLALGRDGAIWIASSSGLIKMDDDSFEHFHAGHGLASEGVQSIAMDPDGTMWLGTDSGLSHFDGTRFTNYNPRQSLAATVVYDVMVDREENIWVGTLGAGLNLFVGEVFTNFTIDNGLLNNVVNAFTEDEQGNVYVAMYGGGISKITPDGDMEHFRQEQGLQDDKLFTLYADSRSRVWIGSREGISILENGRIRAIPNERFPFGTVRKFLEDDDGVMWVATYNDGLIRFDGETYRQYNIGSGLLNNTVMDLKKDEYGSLWIATYGGVARMEENNFFHYTVNDGLPSNGVIHIHIDHNGELWFSTFNGVARLSGETIFNFAGDAQTGIVSYFTIQDHENTYWIGTNRGIYRFRPSVFLAAETRAQRLKAYKLFDQHQGLVANELNAGASLVARDGRIWLGTVEGFSIFHTDNVGENTAPPGIEFEEILVSGIPVSENENMVFNFDQNFLQIRFSGLSYESPAQILYEYRMRGVDQEWQTTRERELSYPLLSPGTYEFQLRTYNADGVRSAQTAGFTFQIKNPVWQQWWFLTLVMLGVIGLIYFYYRYFKVKKQIDLERMRVQIASDLHDDVGSSLTELALRTDFLQAGEVSDEVRTTLHHLGEQSRKIVSSLDDIVWSIDARNDTAGDLTDRMQDYVNHIFSNGSVSVSYHFDQLKMNKRLPVHIKENVYLIFKEAINNVAKHSDANVVMIRFSFDGSDFELLVQDNGNTTSGNRKSGQGLRNIQMRAERMKADISINREDGFGVHVTGTV